MRDTYITERLLLASVDYGSERLLEGCSLQIPASRKAARELVIREHAARVGTDPWRHGKVLRETFITFPVEREADLQVGISHAQYRKGYAVVGDVFEHAEFQEGHPEFRDDSPDHIIRSPEYILGVVALSAQAIDGQTNGV